MLCTHTDNTNACTGLYIKSKLYSVIYQSVYCFGVKVGTNKFNLRAPMQYCLHILIYNPYLLATNISFCFMFTYCATCHACCTYYDCKMLPLCCIMLHSYLFFIYLISVHFISCKFCILSNDYYSCQPANHQHFSFRYQIVVEIIHATTISSLPQLKKQKGMKTLQFTDGKKK